MTKELFALIRYAIIGIAIIIASVIVSNGIKSNGSKTQMGGLRNPHMTFPNELTVYNKMEDFSKNKLTVGEGDQLLVQLKSGEKRTFTGSNIVAEFYHASGLLVVTYLDQEEKKVFYTYEPLFLEPLNTEEK